MTDSALYDHRRWLGFIQPIGLVVSPPALVATQAILNLNIAAEHRAFLDWVRDARLLDGSTLPAITDWPGLFKDVFGWQADDLQPAPPQLWTPLPAYEDVLRPTYAVRENAEAWLLLMQVCPVATDLDQPLASAGWPASPQARFERLLREQQIPLGLLTNGAELRLINAPPGENAGTLIFRIAELITTDGRLMFAALHLLLGADRLFNLPPERRLPAILAESRRYQNTISTDLAAQVVAALYELLRGFQSADAQTGGALLGAWAAREPNRIYDGLLTVLLRLIFVLFAEDRGLISTDPLYVNHYAVSGLFSRLQADAGRYPDTMDSRYGAWAQLLALFRLIHGGARHGALQLTARRGRLFDPAIYPFLEGGTGPGLPRISDGVVYRVLAKLMVLHGERLSYRMLDVEHIGSVYEAMMGFTLLRAPGPMLAIRHGKTRNVAVMVDLAALQALAPTQRAKWLKEDTEQTLTGAALDAVQAAQTQAALRAALAGKIADEIAAEVVAPGSLVLQPTDERRKTGSHYTPPELSRPMVKEALRPVLTRLGENPTPEQILSLKVCDPAMGSGAFLVEACKQLAEALVTAWRAHRATPGLLPDEDEALHARRVVALHCLYGVDKNPRAVELAQLSLWLATLAKDHAFTFLDHALKCGDSLIGVLRSDLARVPPSEKTFASQFKAYWELQVSKNVLPLRLELQQRAEKDPESNDKEAILQTLLHKTQIATSGLQGINRALLAPFFQRSKNKRERALAQKEALAQFQLFLKQQQKMELLQQADKTFDGDGIPLNPFHWELEFPEVFGRDNPGFDVIVGNPPFVGGQKITGALGTEYRDYLIERIAHGQKGSADLCAYFFLRAGQLLRDGGMMALLATNTIAQGDTREVGLDQLTAQGFSIPRAVPSAPWPGEASLEVAQVWLYRGAWPGAFVLNEQPVAGITPFLTVPGQVAGKPYRLAANADRSFQGSIVLGMGFVLTPEEAQALIARNPRNQACLFPYLNGEDLNSRFDQSPSRWVINFHDWPLNRGADGVWRTADAKQRKAWLQSGIVPADYPDPVAVDYPDLLAIVRERAKPERDKLANGDASARDRAKRWWQFGRPTIALYSAIVEMETVLVSCRVTKYIVNSFVPTGYVYDVALNVLTRNLDILVSICDSSIYDSWVRQYASSLETRVRYTLVDCFETFPFPLNLSGLDAIGERYYTHRQTIMQTRREGLTATYNRFHNPNDRAPNIQQLRDLHVEMDHAVAAAYGWQDLALDHAFHDTKQGLRYTVSESARRELLDRLLALNHQRHEEEVAAAEAQRQPR